MGDPFQIPSPFPAAIPAARIQGELTFDFIRPPDRRKTITSGLLDATNDAIVLTTELAPSKPLACFGEIVMDVGDWAVWFLFKGRPYDVSRVYRADGTWTGYYADVLEPVRWVGSDPTTLTPIVDLFLDLWIAPDGRYLILDEDEFEDAIVVGRITAAQADHVRRVLEDLVEATRRGVFPPDVVKNFR